MILETRGLGVVLGGRRVLDVVDFAPRPGALTALIGPNGAGKSTLLKTLAGLLQPSRGHVALDGRPLDAFTRADIARRIAYLPQEREIFWPVRARDLVALGRLPWHGASGALGETDRAAVDRALAALDLAAVADRPTDRLSGGERARVLLARALAQETPILIADEPAASLDPAHQVSLFERLAAMAASGCTVLVAVHDLSLAARFCTLAALLVDGQLVASGAASEVLTSERLSPAFGIEMRIGRLDELPVILPAHRASPVKP